MKRAQRLRWFGAVIGTALALSAGSGRAQSNDISASPPATVETGAPEADRQASMQAELLQAYIRLQAQLNDAQLSIERSRSASEKSAREQAAAITEKLNAIEAALDADWELQRKQMDRFNQNTLWVAGIFGCAGVLAMLLSAIFQWRTMNRVVEAWTMRPQLAAGGGAALLPAGPDLAGGRAVELSNQRLMAVIERLERRVFELEHPASKPASELDGGDPSVPEGERQDKLRIAALLEEGQALLNEDKAQQALDRYDAILELNPNHSEALVKKGSALERLKQDEEALRCYDRAIEADRTLTIAYLYKGGIYNRLERYNEALECYEQALRAQGQPG